jgi:hypothetical protein
VSVDGFGRDLGTGQPLEHALRTAVLAVRLAELAGASPDDLRDTYYVALLHASGCTSNGHDWDLEGWGNFASDPEVPAIMQEAGHKSRPQVGELVGRFDA